MSKVIFVLIFSVIVIVQAIFIDIAPQLRNNDFVENGKFIVIILREKDKKQAEINHNKIRDLFKGSSLIVPDRKHKFVHVSYRVSLDLPIITFTSTPDNHHYDNFYSIIHSNDNINNTIDGDVAYDRLCTYLFKHGYSGYDKEFQVKKQDSYYEMVCPIIAKKKNSSLEIIGLYEYNKTLYVWDGDRFILFNPRDEKLQYHLSIAKVFSEKAYYSILDYSLEERTN